MRKKYKKSTKEEVEQMRRLYQEGFSLNAISQRLKKDHTTILYWLKKTKNHIPAKKPTTVLIKKGEVKKIEPNPNACLNCPKLEKDPKWEKTRFCSLKCWDEYHRLQKPTLY